MSQDVFILNSCSIPLCEWKIFSVSILLLWNIWLVSMTLTNQDQLYNMKWILFRTIYNFGEWCLSWLNASLIKFLVDTSPMGSHEGGIRLYHFTETSMSTFSWGSRRGMFLFYYSAFTGFFFLVPLSFNPQRKRDSLFIEQIYLGKGHYCCEKILWPKTNWRGKCLASTSASQSLIKGS